MQRRRGSSPTTPSSCDSLSLELPGSRARHRSGRMPAAAVLSVATRCGTMPFDRLDGEAPAFRLPDTALELLRLNRRLSKRWAAV
jgi:hypothetical protein